MDLDVQFLYEKVFKNCEGIQEDFHSCLKEVFFEVGSDEY